MTIIVKKIKGAIRETLKFSCEDLKKSAFSIKDFCSGSRDRNNFVYKEIFKYPRTKV